MTLALVRERCWIHPPREAAARCPSCQRFFCRECVTEHDGRLLCADCLRGLRASAEQRRWRPAWRARGVLTAVARTASLALSLLAAWFFFHVLAQTLVSLPNDFHADTLWQQLGVGSGGDDD